MKVSDLLKHIIDPIGIKNNDLEAALQASGLKEIELPDEVRDKFDRHYFTKDRALNDEEITRALQKEARGLVFGSVDQKIKKILPLLSEEDQNEINSTKDTLEKVELMQKAISKIRESGSSEDVKKVSAKAREIEQELRTKNEELVNQIKQKEESFQNELKKEKLFFHLRNKIGSVKLAPEFDSDSYKKEFLANSTIDKITKSFVLDFDEANRSEIRVQKNVDGHLKDYYEGNQKVSLDQLIAKELDPFIQKSNTQEQSKSTPPKIAEQPSDKPLTLRDMQLNGTTY